MDSVRLVLLDVGGTLLHKPDVPAAIADALHAHGIEASPRDVAEAVHRLSEARRFPPTTTRDFYLEFNAEIVRWFGAGTSESVVADIYDRCRDLPWAVFDDVASLRNIGVPLGIVSNWAGDLRALIADKVELRFEPIVVSAEEGVAKPDARLFEIALRRAGVAPHQAAYVGDSVTLDLEPAARLGIRTWLLDRARRYPDAPHVLRSLRDLPSALGRPVARLPRTSE